MIVDAEQVFRPATGEQDPIEVIVIVDGGVVAQVAPSVVVNVVVSTEQLPQVEAPAVEPLPVETSPTTLLLVLLA